MTSDAVDESLILYHGWSSSASRKVRFALAEKQLAYVSHPINIRKNEHHSPEYRKINPNAVVPALIHNGAQLIESTFINEYLDEAFPGNPLRPATPLERHAMRLWCRDVDEKYLPAVLKHNWQRTIHPIARNWTDAELEAKLANIPSPERRNFWYRPYRTLRNPGGTGQRKTLQEIQSGYPPDCDRFSGDRHPGVHLCLLPPRKGPPAVP